MLPIKLLMMPVVQQQGQEAPELPFSVALPWVKGALEVPFLAALPVLQRYPSPETYLAGALPRADLPVSMLGRWHLQRQLARKAIAEHVERAT